MKTRPPLFSTKDELSQLTELIRNYKLLPFSPDNVPGGILEGVFGHVRQAQVLRTYDFVDVVRRGSIGWQVKSTMESTPITWGRVKLERRNELIADSESSASGLQRLGDHIIGACNNHAAKSFALHDLREIGYARLIVHSDNSAIYFERKLCTRSSPEVFDASQFRWKWSTQKKSSKKEQLSALHGLHILSGAKWFAWHGRGENQLHFSGERNWWPAAGDNVQQVRFTIPSETDRLSIEAFARLLASSTMSTMERQPS